MLEFKQDDTQAHLILTLNESISIVDPNFLFLFTHVTTKATVAFVLTQADDQSVYPDRYNDFIINPSVLFLGKDPGEWHYKIYEQASAVNTDPTLSGAILEEGKLYLDRAVPFAFTKYDTPTTYSVYNG